MAASVTATTGNFRFCLTDLFLWRSLQVRQGFLNFFPTSRDYWYEFFTDHCPSCHPTNNVRAVHEDHTTTGITFLFSLIIQWGGTVRLACWPSVHRSSIRSFVKQPIFVWYAVLHQEQLMATISWTTAHRKFATSSFKIRIKLAKLLKFRNRLYSVSIQQNIVSMTVTQISRVSQFSFYFLFSYFLCLVLCDRLSWIPGNFWAQIKHYTSYHTTQ